MESSDKIVLYMDYFWLSPYVFSSFIALKEKGVPFEIKLVELQNKGQILPEYREKSLTSRVPSIEHGSFTSAIAEYLEETFPPEKYQKLFPTDRLRRARARQVPYFVLKILIFQLMAWIRSDLLALREERPTFSMFFEEHRAKTPLSEKATQMLLKLSDSVIPEDSGFLFGEFTLADAELAFMLHRLILNGHEVPPKILKYAQSLWKRPSIAEFVKHERGTYVPYIFFN